MAPAAPGGPGAAHGAIAAAASQHPPPGPRARADSAPAGLPLHASRPTSPPERQQKLELEKEHGSARHWQARRYPQGLVRLIQEQLQRPRPLVPAALGHAPPPKHLPQTALCTAYAARLSTFGCGVVCEVKASMRSCLAHVCSRKCADLLFVHHRESIGQAWRRLAVLHHTTTPCARRAEPTNRGPSESSSACLTQGHCRVHVWQGSTRSTRRVVAARAQPQPPPARPR